MRWGRQAECQSCHPGWATWLGRHEVFLFVWRPPTAAHHLSSSAGLNLNEECYTKMLQHGPLTATREKTTISPLVSSSSSTTLLMSLNSDSSWIFILEKKNRFQNKYNQTIAIQGHSNACVYLLSPQEAALFNTGEMATLLRLSLWLRAWYNSCPISLMWVEITTRYPWEKPISMYPSPYLGKEKKDKKKTNL